MYYGAREGKLLVHGITATDDERIYIEAVDLGINVVMTSKFHKSGMDRCQEMVYFSERIRRDDVVINIQGGEPLICAEVIDLVVNVFETNTVPKVGSLVRKIGHNEAHNPNIVKVTFDRQWRPIYLSRTPITLNADQYYGHVGI